MKKNSGRKLMIAAQLNKFILFIFIFSSTAFSMESTVLLAQLEYVEAKNAYEKQISICTKGEEKVIPLKEFYHLELTKEEWKTALLYFYKNTYKNCV